VDHNISDADRLFARFQLGRRAIASNSGGNGAPVLNDTTNLVYNIYPDRNGVLSWTHSFSPTLFSEFLFSDSWEYFQFYTGTSANSDVDYARQPFPNNQIPASMESPLAKYLYGITPLPTLAGVNPFTGNN
jgi:hypothetical protein